MKAFEVDGEMRELDENCLCVNSDLCYWLSGRVGCERCYIGTLKNDEQKEEARDRWKDTLSLLPHNFDALHESEDCQFCKGKIEKATEYAVFEMANPEPFYAKGMFFGLGKKVRTPVGSLVSVQASVCNKCKKAFRIADFIQIGGLVLGIVIGIVLLLIPAIAQPMFNIFALLPIIFLVLMGVAGFYVGKNAYLAYFKKMSKTVKMDLAEIPTVAIMLNKGWFFFQMNNGMPRVSFSKKKQFSRMVRKGKVDSAKEEDISLDNMNI